MILILYEFKLKINMNTFFVYKIILNVNSLIISTTKKGY